MSNSVISRSSKLAFLGVMENDTVTYHRMTGFTELSKKLNAKEYSRRYVDEDLERVDVVGYSPEYSYSFDSMLGNPVHESLARVADEEELGFDAKRDIIIVDMSELGTGQSCTAVKRTYTVIPDTEGDSQDAYTYSGTLRADGLSVAGTATSEDDWQTISFS